MGFPKDLSWPPASASAPAQQAPPGGGVVGGVGVGGGQDSAQRRDPREGQTRRLAGAAASCAERSVRSRNPGRRARAGHRRGLTPDWSQARRKGWGRGGAL